MADPRQRTAALARLAVAYARHQIRRTIRRAPPRGVAEVRARYAADHYEHLTARERALFPEMSRCINCGVCALVAGRLGQTYVPDLATAYLRPLHLLPATAGDFDGPASADLAEAAAACPVGVPLPAVAAIVRRLAQA